MVTTRVSPVLATLSIKAKHLALNHVKDIIKAVKAKYGVELERDSLSSALTKYDRKQKRFQRVAPNTFELRQA